MGRGESLRTDGEPAFVSGSPLLREAHAFATKAHADQRRRGSEGPYVVHPLAVAARLSAEGLDEEAVAAGILHDVVEDSEASLDQIAERFGQRVGALVEALTEDPSIEDWDARKRALRRQVAAAEPSAAAIYAADKLSNVRDARVLYAKVGEEAGKRFEVPLDQRLGAWRADLEMVAKVAPTRDLVADLRSELDALERERAEAQRQVGASR
jgi:(p)ppGpp synthase/HD superfamily hydrolase